MVHYSPPQLRYLKDPADLAALLAEDAASAARAAVVAVTFGPNFDVRDEHVQRLLAALGPQLRSIRLGSSDTGHGTWLTDAAVHAVVAACGPNLQVLYLESCTSVTDKAFLAAVEGLPNLQVLGVTGHDRSIGKITKKALAPLLKGALPQLRELYLTDQGYDIYDAVDRLLRKRKQLRVQAGETDGDSAAWGCVLAAQGRSYGDGLYGRW